MAPTVAMAQDYTSGNLSGTVTDDAGKPIAGATVSVTSTQGSTRTTKTDADGGYRIPALSVGGYSATISAAGFPTLENQSIRVAPGSSSYAFTLSNQSVSELVITATRKTQDFSKTDTGLVVDVQDLASRVPLGRSINAAVLLAPGVGIADPSIAANGVRRNQSAVTLSGTSAAESAYYINGINVTDQRNFLGYADLPFEAIQAVDVKTGGYQAEFGRGTGGVINIVTRSGSNEFHGGVSTYWTPNSLRAKRGEAYAPGGNNSVGQLVLNQYSKADSSEQTVWASGPIMEDHIFFFLLYNARQSKSWGAASFANPTTATGTITRTKSNDPRWIGKFDFVLNENHKLEATIFSDTTTTDYNPYNFARSNYTIGAALNNYYQKSGGLNQIYKYTGVFADWFTLSGTYGRIRSDQKDYGANVNVPGIIDQGALFGGYATGGRQGGPFNLEGVDLRKTYRVDGDFYFKLLGDHHFRVGYDREDLTSTAVSAYSGGALYTAYSQASCPDGASSFGCVGVVTFANIGSFTARQTAAYVQDSWEVTPNFSLQLGLRADIYNYKNSSGQSYIKIDNQLAPRIGFNWDPTGNGDDRIYGSVGDYYLPIATNTSIRASSGEVYTEAYYQTTRSGPCLSNNTAAAPNNCAPLTGISADGYPVLGAQIGATDYYSPPGGPDPRTVTEDGLKPMYEREFVLGYEHRFREGMLSDWTFGARAVYRQLKSTIEDTAIGDAVSRYCARKSIATCNDPSVYPYVLVNPGDGARVFIDLEGDTTKIGAAANPAYNPQWIDLTAEDMKLPKTKREYKALQLTFERAFDGKWGLQGSYVLAKSKGNYEGAVKSDVGQTDTSITQDFDHYANTVGAYGNLPNDRRHTFKVFGTYAPVERLTIGANFTAQSGRPYGCIGYLPQSIDPLAPNSGTPSAWYCPLGTAKGTAGSANASIPLQLAAAGQPNVSYNSIMTPRGASGHTDWNYQVDLSVSYRIMESDTKGSLVAVMDIFNLLDGDKVTRVVEQGEVRTSASGVKGVRAPYYGLPRTYQSPRTVRFGLRYAF
ncbi:TonB-dependent receptor [Caulobacter segnis]|uniref:TonB-dependent receptor n=1 Tax=Caulobacter segnis TaxID=88688 RepID=UPI0028589794|nr:TonB-dependent receptor [Caulobacter segnis]MDR6626314.1 outer membrane receptor protein involved in Fe transport [Caulobacter segnis]